MRLTTTDRFLIVLAVAALTWITGTWQDPPRTIEPAPMPKPEKEDVDGVFVFDDEQPVAKVKRFKLGQRIVDVDDEDPNRTYIWGVHAAGVRPSTALYDDVTDEEFEAWLALPEGHEFEYDLDGYIGSIRG